METTHSNEILWKVSDFARNLKYLFRNILTLLIHKFIIINWLRLSYTNSRLGGPSVTKSG